MNLTLFCSQRLESSSTPGSTVSQVNMVGVRAPNTAAKGPNDELFSPEQQQASVNLVGLNEAAMAEFKSGVKYRVTIEEIAE